MTAHSSSLQTEDQTTISRRSFLKAGLFAGIVGAGGGGFLLGACQQDDDDDDGDIGLDPTPDDEDPDEDVDDEDTDDGDEPEAGGVLVVGWEEDAATLDPAKTICGHETRLAQLYTEPLWTLYGDSIDIKPALAEAWEVSEDGIIWDVTIRPGVMFHDGTTCDAEAIKWSTERWLDPDHPFHDPPYGLLAYDLGKLASVEVTGDLALRLTLSEVDAIFEINAATQRGGIVSPTAVEELGNEAFGSAPVGTGPWQVTEWERGVRIVMDRFDDYWGEPALLDQLIIRPIVESAQRLTQLQSGEVDMVIAMPPEFIPTIEADDNLQIIQTPGFHIWFMPLHMQEEHMQHLEVRQALNYAVDKQAIVDEILQGAGVLTAGPTIPHSWASDPDIEPYPYDPDRARELLAEAGFADGFTTRFWVPDSGSGMIAPREIAQIVQANLADVGVNAEIVTQEWTSYVADWAGDGLNLDGEPYYGIAQMSWNFRGPDPGLWYNPTLATSGHPPNAFNGGFYTNERVDEILEELNGTLDQDERAALFHEAQRIMWEDCPWIFMFSANNVAAATARLSGVVLNPSPGVVRFETGYLND